MRFRRRWNELSVGRRLLAGALALLVVALLIVAAVAAYTHRSPQGANREREARNTEQKIVADVTGLYPIQVVDIVVPHTIDDIVAEVRKSQHVSIGGGRNSMGGQTASERAVQLDMREYTKVLGFSTTTKEITVQSYAEYFTKNVNGNPEVIFHNGDMYPPDFTHVSAVTWSTTDKPPTTQDRLIPKSRDYWLERAAWMVMSDWPGGRWIREHVFEPLIFSGTAPVHTRNYEASYDIAELEPESRDRSTYVLQEYFVPVENFDAWVPKMKKVFDDNDVNVLNVSIRFAHKDPGSLLAWARGDTFAFVVYYKQGTDEAAKQAVTKWTREMIDQVLTVNGTYYLPYQPQATEDQFLRAYPGAPDYFALKERYDPTDKFTNNLWDTYYKPGAIDTFRERQRALAAASTTPDYFRPNDNMYLSIPEWYIVYSADEYARVLRDTMPSRFSYFYAIQDYWSQYLTANDLVASSTHDNSDYRTVLKVIGASFTAENYVKGLYENTLGRISECLAGNAQVPEDRYAARVAQDYATFIYDYPWYDFPYGTSLKELWSVHAEHPYTLGQDVRRGERKVFLSLEYGVKALYAKAIGALTRQKYGVQDDVVYAVATDDHGASYYLISAPHYQPFTRAVLERMEAEKDNDGFSIVDISGNESITVSYLAAPGSPLPLGANELIRDTELKSVEKGNVLYEERVIATVRVRDLAAVYRDLAARTITIDHLYDY